MTPGRKLGLRGERLTELTNEELYRVAVAAQDAPPTAALKECLSMDGYKCVTYRCTTNVYCTGTGATDLC